MIVKGDLDPTLTVTHRFKLSDAKKVYPLFDKRDEKDGIQKVFLETRFSAPAAQGTPRLAKV
jgi:threonine dehydrogenase-like Zn-dependent dehydrogenase